ncbi:MAG TPA: DUF2652 domain-containing protein, partial [Candidatus Limnocylindrales bacterium]|nr:DUF2652 domain-containing protein [Candidatus Limnocylindrales bacterium]
MINRPEPACLLIADISGYTSYLAGVELDHAQDILADLVDTVVGALRPTFRLAKLEGDAAFAYAIAETVDGSLLQDTVEATYFAFRRRLRDIRQASRCECNACILIPSLDLKFVVHHGPVARQRVAGSEELVGRDVIVVHRLLKNAVEAATGMRAYALYTDQCLRAAGVDPLAQGLVGHVETVDVIGEVRCWLRDLQVAWEAEQERARVIVALHEAYATLHYEVPAPPQLVWEFATSPARRPQWGAGIDAILERSPTGRRGAGTTNHCVHGRDAIVEEILDWRPYEYWTTRNTLPVPGAPKVVMTDAYFPLEDGGTRIELRIGRPKPRERRAFEEILGTLRPMFDTMAEQL